MSYVILIVAGVLIVAPFVYTRRGTQWGSTAEERAMTVAGDAWLAGKPGARLRMTRAISVPVPPEAVWPWLAQLGRGAGWYSHDRLDNGSRPSAQHLVSWIPEPSVGDAAAIGYLRHLEIGREIAWWIPSTRFLGTGLSSAMTYRVSRTAEGDGARVVLRIAGVATGWFARPFVALFAFIDTIMACRQLKNLATRVTLEVPAQEADAASETGARDQYQLYHVIYASGEEAGVRGKEAAARWRQAAVDDGVLPVA